MQGEPFKLTVRAWDLQDACRKAAEVPFPNWQMPIDEPEHSLGSGTFPRPQERE